MKLVSSYIGVFKRKTSGFLDKPVNQSRDLYVVRHSVQTAFFESGAGKLIAR